MLQPVRITLKRSAATYHARYLSGFPPRGISLDLDPSISPRSKEFDQEDPPHKGLRDIDIARAARMIPITDVVNQVGIPAGDIEAHGKFKAKLPFEYIDTLQGKPDGKLILVTAITPTKAGEGKTTTSVGLADGLCHLGKNAISTLREPSLGPVFGMKGGAAGGGYAQVVPMDDINLHFTGDFHAISAAHNLLSAMVDNHIYWSKAPKLDSRRVSWGRVVDMNDRALRQITNGLGGPANGYARTDSFQITVASEVMAIFCLAKDLEDLEYRMSKIIVGEGMDKKPITCGDIKAQGAMTALLKDALRPNLVQTLENNISMIHGGPFANIAHGCNSVIATKTSLKLADYVVTEAGFGADLGAEKFLNIKCRKANLTPSAVVVVATVRALKLHGGADAKTLQDGEDVSAVKGGMPNLLRHLENISKFGLPSIVAINKFPTDTDAEVAVVQEGCDDLGVQCVMSDHYLNGGPGAADLAKAVVELTDKPHHEEFRFLYEEDLSLEDKVRTIAKEIYRADDISIAPEAAAQFKKIQKQGFGHFPVCMAKTQYSFAADPKNTGVGGAPDGHILPIREVRVSAGAEFVVCLTGEIMTMPGLPKVPAAEAMGVGDDGYIYGLF